MEKARVHLPQRRSALATWGTRNLHVTHNGTSRAVLVGVANGRLRYDHTPCVDVLQAEVVLARDEVAHLTNTTIRWLVIAHQFPVISSVA